MNIKLTETVKTIANGVDNDGDRPEMAGVLINKDEAVASDGFILVIKPIPPQGMNLDGTPNDGINEVIVPASVLKACPGKEILLETIESIRSSANEMDKILGDDKKIIVRLNGLGLTVEADAIMAAYPSFKQMFAPSPLVTQIAFNTKILKKLLKTLPDDSLLQMRISGADNVVEFQCPDPDGGLPIRGAVMPMHAAWLNTTWKTPEEKKSVVDAVIDGLVKEVAKSPDKQVSENENTVTIKQGDKSVTLTDKQFKDAANKIVKGK